MKQDVSTRLFSLPTTVSLGVISVLGLILLYPSKETLLQLIDESATADISLAFLKELDNDDNSTDIILSLAKNYLARGDYHQAIEALNKIIKDDKYQYDNQILKLYINTLIQQNNASNGNFSTQIIENLEDIQLTLVTQLDVTTAYEFAQYAQQLERPDISFNILSPHASLHGKASYQKLISLALETDNLDQAIKLSSQLFSKSETLENAKLYLRLLLQANDNQAINSLLTSYKGHLIEQPAFLKVAAKYAQKSGDLDTAISYVDMLLAIQPNVSNYELATELALAKNNLPLSAKYLSKALQLSPSAEGFLKLNQIYIWLGEILQAQRSSLQSIAINPTQESVRKGIGESKALGDVATEAKLYILLSEKKWIKNNEYDDWINAIEKGIGNSVAIQQVNTLLSFEPNSPVLLGHLARLYSYNDEHQLVIDTLNRLANLQLLTFSQAKRLANAFVMLDDTKSALDAMQMVPNWKDASEDYIELLARLAYENEHKPLSIQTLQHLKDMESEAFDIFRYIRLSLPVNAKNFKDLLSVYRDYGDQSLLALLLAYAYENKQDTLFNALIVPTLDKPEYSQNSQILIWQAQHYVSAKHIEKVRDILLRVLILEPDNTNALNNLIWFALNQKQSDFLKELYHHFKNQNLSRPETWLAMASLCDYLGFDKDGLFWYEKILAADLNPSLELDQQTLVTLLTQKKSGSVLLNYASLLERVGDDVKARAIRKYLMSHFSDLLKSQPDSDITYRSLVNMFISPAISKILVTDNAINSPSEMAMIELFAQNLSDNQGYKILYWQQQKAFSEFKIPDWQQLSLAIQQKNISKVRKLLDAPNNFSVSDKYYANQQIGKHQKAWELGETFLGNTKIPINEQSLLRQLHIEQHPVKTTSLNVKYSQISTWDENRLDIDYFSPHKNGNYRLSSYQKDMALPTFSNGIYRFNESGLKISYLHQLASSSWQLTLDLGDGLAQSRFGLLAEYDQRFNDYFSGKIYAGINMPNKQSRLMHAIGKENNLGFEWLYQPTARENISVSGAIKSLSTRLNEDIAAGWSLNIRATEQLFFDVPAFQVYADINVQKYIYSSSELTRLNTFLDSLGLGTYQLEDFTREKFQRLSIGQRLNSGSPGIPGQTASSPSYWLDTSIGYNHTIEDFDLNVSLGLGLSVLGDDELYLTIDWQSADRFGDEYMYFSLGYFYGL